MGVVTTGNTLSRLQQALSRVERSYLDVHENHDAGGVGINFTISDASCFIVGDLSHDRLVSKLCMRWLQDPVVFANYCSSNNEGEALVHDADTSGQVVFAAHLFSTALISKFHP